jgi:hypothetical protein
VTIFLGLARASTELKNRVLCIRRFHFGVQRLKTFVATGFFQPRSPVDRTGKGGAE